MSRRPGLTLTGLGFLVATSCATTAVHPPTRASRHGRHHVARDRAAVRHLLDRFAYGARAGDVERITHAGIDAWFEEQLRPESIDDAHGQAALAPYADALRPPSELFAEFQAREDERGMLTVRPASSASPSSAPPAMTVMASSAPPTASASSSPPPPSAAMVARAMDLNTLLGQFQLTVISRAVGSERQLFEVMTDFWMNHFNVYARKGPVQWLAADFVEHAIRPHALGHFEDLLVATARHPAMLVYLDNWRSTAAGEVYGPNRRHRGLNENYARELLELHTLGVDGGYSQDDVVNVARILTGWTMSAPEEGQFVFEFRAGWHDRDAKTALGTEFPAGGGEEEGTRLLHLLAEHPSTARFIARRLVERFVADDAPSELVDRVAATYRDTHGDIAAMLRTIVHSEAFGRASESSPGFKTPLEFLVSALRSVGATPDGTLGLAQVLTRLGEPPFLQPVPTGYPDRASAWLNTSALLDRMNIALTLARGQLPGVRFNVDSAFPPGLDHAALVDAANTLVLHGSARPDTLSAIRNAVDHVTDAHQARVIALAMCLASSEFQTQ